MGEGAEKWDHLAAEGEEGGRIAEHVGRADAERTEEALEGHRILDEAILQLGERRQALVAYRALHPPPQGAAGVLTEVVAIAKEDRVEERAELAVFNLHRLHRSRPPYVSNIP